MLNKLTIFLSLFAFAAVLNAQNNTKSIYSSYGVGVFQSQDANAFKGMAASSYGFRHGFKPNLANPLSIAGRERVDFNLGFEFNNRLQQTSAAQRTDLAGNVNHVSFAFNSLRINKEKRYVNPLDTTELLSKWRKIRINTMLGLAPYTAMDYDYAIEGDTSTFESLLSVGGKGGLNSIYFNNAFQVLDTTISVGISVQRLFGSITESRLKNLLSDSAAVGYQQTIDQRIKGMRYGLTLGYSGKPKPKSDMWHTFTAGYTFKSTLNSETDVLLRTVQDFFQVKDTLSLSSPKGTIELPSILRLGYGLENENKWAWSVDFQSSDLTQYSNTIDSSSMNRMTRISTGFILNPERMMQLTENLEWFRKVEWSFGAFYQTGPFAVQNTQSLSSINEYGISFGVALPMKSRFNDKKTVVSYMYLNAQYSQRGTINDGLIKEDIFRVNLAFNLSDKWFKKRAYY